MPVDPQIQALLDRGAGVAATDTLSVADARAQYESRIPLMPRPAEIAGAEDRLIDGPRGKLRLRIYTPRGSGPFPLMVFYHGSGFVLCSIETHDGMCRNFSAGAGCVVVSVDYGLAPEHKFPAGLEDCVHATRWCLAHADTIGADASRVAVAGDSAGGNLAAVIALRMREGGKTPFCAQLLIYPVTDHFSANTKSYEENAEGFGLTRATMIWFWNHYLRDAADAANPDAAPLRAPDLRGLPPAFIATAEFDPLRDEAEHYAVRLTDAGVPVEMVRYPGMNHGFFFWVGRVDTAGAAMTDACLWLKAAFSWR